MNFIKEKEKIYAKDEYGKLVAEIDFIEVEKGVYDICHTFVDESLRGKGIASMLVQEAVKEIQSRNGKIKASCSYAKKWIEKKMKIEKMLEGINVLCHSSIRINKGKVIYIDPFKIEKDFKDADIIFITHDHYDHYSEPDIDKVRKDETIVVAPESLLENLYMRGFKRENIIVTEPGEKDIIGDIVFETVPAYNINKQLHPKEKNWVGYILEIAGVRYYIAGDTDFLEENRNVLCDVAFVPVGGTYTMDYKEAADFVNEIQPKIAIPIHYGSVVGTRKDAEDFVSLLNPEIKSLIPY